MIYVSVIILILLKIFLYLNTYLTIICLYLAVSFTIHSIKLLHQLKMED